MASLVVKAMVQGGVKVLMGCEPQSLERDEASGLLTQSVAWVHLQQLMLVLLLSQEMASLVMKAMVQGGVKVLMGCEPQSIERDEASGLLTVTWMTASREQMCDQFDTVLMAAGQLQQQLQ